MIARQCPQPGEADVDAALAGLTSHGMIASSVCRCGERWPCATALDLAIQATREGDRLRLWRRLR